MTNKITTRCNVTDMCTHREDGRRYGIEGASSHHEMQPSNYMHQLNGLSSISLV